MKLLKHTYFLFWLVALFCFALAFEKPERRMLNIILGSLNTGLSLWEFIQSRKNA